jgi:hypothetical protein
MLTLVEARIQAHEETSARSYLLYLRLGIAVTGLNIIAPADLTYLERVLASAILIISFIPTLRFVSRAEGVLPFLPLLGGVYALHYALPVFLLDPFDFRGWVFPHSTIEKSLLLVLMGLVSLLVAFYWFPLIGNFRMLPRIAIPWDIGKVKRAAPMIGLIGLVLTYVRITNPIPLVLQQVVLFVSNFSLLAIFMLFTLQLQGRLGLPQRLFLWGFLFPAQLMLDLSTGAVYQVIKDIVPLILIYGGLRRRIPWAVVLIGLLLLILLRGNQREFRFVSRSPSYQEISIPERNRLYAAIVMDNASSGGITEEYALTLERVSHLITFADVVEQTPRTVPYWYGESYYTLLTSLIPRIVWPDKPTKTLGQTFGHRYQRLYPEDDETSENFPQLVEMYANFGPPGVLLGMFIVGLIYRLLYSVMNHSEAGEGGLLISAVIFTVLLSIESDFSLTFGAVIQYTVLLYILNTFLRQKKSGRRHSFVTARGGN